MKCFNTDVEVELDSYVWPSRLNCGSYCQDVYNLITLCLWVVLSTFVRFTYWLSNILWFLNVLQNGEMCIHCVEYLKTKEKLCIMAIKESILLFDFRLPPWYIWDLHSSGTLCSVNS